MSMDISDIEWRCGCGHTTPDFDVFCAGCGQYRYYGEEAEAPIVIGSKVRRIDEPYVVLRVREIDPEGLIDGTPKALCTNAYAHGRWMALTELEVVT